MKTTTNSIYVALAIFAVGCFAVPAAAEAQQSPPPRAYITNLYAGSVSVIDTSNNTIVATVPVGSYPDSVAVNCGGTRVYVANSRDDSVSVIDTSTNAVVATVPGVVGDPQGIAVNPAGTRVYVTGAGTNLGVIDTTSNTVTASIDVSPNSASGGVAVTPDGAHAYVNGTHGVSVIDTQTNTVATMIPIVGSPTGLAINAAGTRVYAVVSGDVVVIDTATNTVVATVNNVGFSPYSVTVNPAGTFIYVTSGGNNSSVSVIDTSANAVVATIPVGHFAYGMDITPGGDFVYVANGGSNTVSVIDTSSNTVVATIGGFVGPQSIFGKFIAPGCAPTCQISSSIASNFNGTAINAGNYIWFNGVLKPSGLGSTPVTIRFSQQKITSANFTLSVPDASVTFDPAATSATTTFSGGMWVTRVPSSGLAGNTFLSALGYLVPANLPGGIKNVTWSGTVSPDTPGVSVQWKWAAAVYKSFSSDYNVLGVKPVDDNNASQYQNSDHAGTPENFKAYVVGGATGGGGSNYTGGYSGTAGVGPCP